MVNVYGAGSGVKLSAHQMDVMQLFLEFEDYVGHVMKHPRPFFIQVGAHDGKTVDPIRPYMGEMDWEGLFIEPQPEAFDRLRANYPDENKFRCERCAISERSGEIKMYRHRDAGYFATTLCSTKAMAVMCNGHNVSGALEELVVPAYTMRDVIDRHEIKVIDYLFTDTEGCDEIVVRQVIEAGFRPRLIRYENWGHRPFEQAIFPFLIDSGYSFAQVDIDIICIQQDKWAQAALKRDIPVEQAADHPW